MGVLVCPCSPGTAGGRGAPDGQSGSVTVIKRFGSGLLPNVHSHALFLDGVLTEAADGTLRFPPAAPPTDVEGRPAGRDLPGTRFADHALRRHRKGGGLE